MNVRGNSSRTDAKVNWKVEMPKGYEFDLGGQLPYPLDEFALQNYGDNFADVGWATVKGAGERGLNIIPVRTQRNGNFWSLGRIMETEDGTWRDDKGVDNWSIYKGDGGSLARTSSVATLVANEWLDKKSRKDEDYTDVWTMSNNIDAGPSAAQQSCIYHNVNVPAAHQLHGGQLDHPPPGLGLVQLVDRPRHRGHRPLGAVALGPQLDLHHAPVDGKGMFLTPDTSNRLTRAVLAYPEFQQMFYRRLRTLADQFLAPGRYEAQWDAITARTLPDWNLDRAMWGGYTPPRPAARSSPGSPIAAT